MIWRTRLLAGLVALLMAAMLVAAVFLSIHYERNEREETLVRATQAAVGGIRAHLRASEQSLGALASDLAGAGGDGNAFRQVAAQLLANDQALLRVELRAEDGRLLEAVDAPAPRPRLDARQREQLGFESTLALRSAVGFERPLYSRSYYVRMSETSGFEIVDLAVPVASQPPRALVASYSMPLLLDRMLPTAILQSHQVYLTEPDGTFVARSSSGLHGAGVYTAAAPLELPGMSLQLRTNSVQGEPKLIPNLLTAMLVVVTLALAGAAALLWRDWRLRANAERALRNQQEKLQANARMALLGEVASVLSHELNQPLAAITSYTTACENLLENEAPADASTLRAALARIRGQSDRAGQVIRSVQDFVRRRQIDCRELAIGDLLRSAEPLIRLQASKNGGRVEWRIDGDAVVFGDRTMLEQVLLNLTRNGFEAMDGMPRPQRLLEIEAARIFDDGRRAVAVEVRDRGNGIASEHEGQLFNAFYTTKPDGLGIGLSLCRTVIEAHGGKLRHRRREGGGAVFRFELPVEESKA